MWLRAGLQLHRRRVQPPAPGAQAIVNRVADILMMEFLRHHVEACPRVPAAEEQLALR